MISGSARGRMRDQYSDWAKSIDDKRNYLTNYYYDKLDEIFCNTNNIKICSLV
jgi:hypothetical protein